MLHFIPQVHVYIKKEAIYRIGQSKKKNQISQ